MKEKCVSCGSMGLFISKPVFEGFKKIGDQRVCASCAAVQPPKSTPTAPSPVSKNPQSLLLKVFGEEPLPALAPVFTGDEHLTICRHCSNYVIHPFTQRCGLHDREVLATDTCADFCKRAVDENRTP